MSDSDATGSVDPAALAVALERLKTLSSDVSEVKSSMVQMAGAVTRLAVMEERLGSSRDALERAFREINDLQTRLKSVENNQPVQAQTTRWVNQVIGLLIAAAVGAVATSSLRPREPAPAAVESRR